VKVFSRIAIVSCIASASLGTANPAKANCGMYERYFEICTYGNTYDLRDIRDGQVAISGDCSSGARWVSWMTFGMASEVHRRVCGVGLRATY
jgi:hypothetical protein